MKQQRSMVEVDTSRRSVHTETPSHSVWKTEIELIGVKVHIFNKTLKLKITDSTHFAAPMLMNELCRLSEIFFQASVAPAQERTLDSRHSVAAAQDSRSKALFQVSPQESTALRSPRRKFKNI